MEGGGVPQTQANNIHPPGTDVPVANGTADPPRNDDT